jgi:hypothetical protein
MNNEERKRRNNYLMIAVAVVLLIILVLLFKDKEGGNMVNVSKPNLGRPRGKYLKKKLI